MYSNFSSVLAQRPRNSVCVFSLFLSFFCRGGGGTLGEARDAPMQYDTRGRPFNF